MTYYLVDRKAKLIFPVYSLLYPQFIQSILDLDRFKVFLEAFEDFQETEGYGLTTLVQTTAFLALDNLSHIDTFNILPVLYCYQQIGNNIEHISDNPNSKRRFMFVEDISEYKDYKLIK